MFCLKLQPREPAPTHVGSVSRAMCIAELMAENRFMLVVGPLFGRGVVDVRHATVRSVPAPWAKCLFCPVFSPKCTLVGNEEAEIPVRNTWEFFRKPALQTAGEQNTDRKRAVCVAIFVDDVAEWPPVQAEFVI